MIFKSLLLSLCLMGLLQADTFQFQTLDLALTRLKPWSPDKHELQGRYYFEYGDGGGEIILKCFLGDCKQEQLLYYGVIFEPSPMLEKQAITVLDPLRLEEDQLKSKKDLLKFYTFDFNGEEIRGILYDHSFFQLLSH